MDPDSRDEVAREILIAEYKALRDEIIKKMDHRATFRISALTITVAAMAAGVQFENNLLLLLVPIVAVLFSNVAVFYSVQIGRAADYIRDHIEPKLDEQLPVPSAGTAWKLSGPLAISIVLTTIDGVLRGVFLWIYRRNRLVL